MKILTPNCPLCGEPPMLNFGDQAFCGNEECKTLTWNPTRGLEQLTEASFIELPRPTEEDDG